MNALRPGAALLLGAAALACGAEQPASAVRETFYADGSPWTSSPWADGRLEGVAATWWPGGVARTFASYVAGELEGPFASWYADGTPREEATYRAGRLHGGRRAWYPSGALESEGLLEDGRRSGRWVFHDAGGTPWVTRDYEAGTGRLTAQSVRVVGDGRTVDCRFEGDAVDLRVEAADGSPRRTGRLVDGARDGLWRRWGEGGVLLLEEHWRAGVRHGPCIAWDAGGRPLAAGRFVAGEREGPWWLHTPGGVFDPERSGTYHRGERTGSLPAEALSPFDHP